MFNWLYNWAWLVGGWIFMTILGITAVLVIRHARRTHRGAWKLYLKYMEYRKTEKAAKRERVKLLADVERSPLLSEADGESIASMEGGIDGRVASGAAGGYGTINADDRPRLNQHQAGWNEEAGSSSTGSSPDSTITRK